MQRGCESRRDVVEECRCFVCRSSLEGGGAGFEPMTCSVEVLRFRASHQCCTEAMSEVGCNSSPILLGKLLDIIKSYCVSNEISLISALQWYSDA